MTTMNRTTGESRKLWIVGLIGVALLACERNIHDMDTGGSPDRGTDGTETEPAPSYPQTAGFVRLESREVAIDSLGLVTSGIIPTAEMFYAFIPADEDAAHKPVIVLFSGGPGAATTSLLTTFGTAPYAMDWQGDNEITPNPGSLTAAGNLLYIDPRQTGFSYEVGLPEEPPSNFSDYHLTYNVFTDASDMILTLLAVLAERPALQDNPVVLLGESFGGARATVMLDLLNHPGPLTQPNTAFRDARLFEAIKTHYGVVFPEIAFESLTPAQTLSQFGWQVLIQPGLILDAPNYMYTTCNNLAPNDVRVPYCNVFEHSAYDIRRGAEAIPIPIEDAAATLLTRSGFETFFGLLPETVPGLPAADRQDAARPLDGIPNEAIAPGDEWRDTLGTLSPRDRYHVPFLADLFDMFSITPACSPRFIRNIAEVNTFITNAIFDGIVSSDKIPEAILQASAVMPQPPVSAARFDMSPIDGVARPGAGFVTFTESNGLGVAAGTRRIRIPLYDDSGHSVPMYQAEAFKDDIIDFLTETGAYDVAASR